MKFCDNCGSHMKETSKGSLCPKCGNLVSSKLEAKAEEIRERDFGAVYVVSNANKNYAVISQACPKCGNNEAVHWFSNISGEHAGVRRERTVEHFRCTKCSHSWSKSH